MTGVSQTVRTCEKISVENLHVVISHGFRHDHRHHNRETGYVEIQFDYHTRRDTRLEIEMKVKGSDKILSRTNNRPEQLCK